MKSFRGFLALVGLLFAGTHLLRHAYVLWIEPRTSVLDRFDEMKSVTGSEKSLADLISAYEQAQKDVKAAEKAQKPSPEDEYRQYKEQPWKSERELKDAIRERERHLMDLRELHFFWWAGAAAVVLGGIVSRMNRPWLGFSFCVLGFLEMTWATFPAISRFGFAIEFKELLTLKVAYSLGMLLLLVAGWLIVERKSDPGRS